MLLRPTAHVDVVRPSWRNPASSLSATTVGKGDGIRSARGESGSVAAGILLMASGMLIDERVDCQKKIEILSKEINAGTPGAPLACRAF
jgi:hypothetical protein